MTKNLVSIIIPARNEKYLKQTIRDLLSKALGEIEIIVVLDGYWPLAEEIVDNLRVNYIHFAQAQGMRNAINSAVLLSKGQFILKIDAHCMVDTGYDVKLKEDCESNWVVVPRRYSLDVEKWTKKNKVPISYMYLSADLHGREWTEKNNDQALNTAHEHDIDDLMSFQGSCWFMHREYYDFLELMDEEHYGPFWYEAQEIGLKCWLSGGRVVVNKKTWYAHWHKPKEVGRGYSLNGSRQDEVTKYVEGWKSINCSMWHKQIYDLIWLTERFKPVPGWEGL